MIVLTPFAVAPLKAWRKDQAERRLTLGAAWTDLNLACERGDGLAARPRFVLSAVKRLMKKVGPGPKANLHEVSPVSGPSVYREHLDRYGNGFHHTCLVYPTVAAVREAKATLVAEGRQMVQEANTGDLFDFAYFAFPEVGSLVEVLFVDVESMPAPEAVI